MLVRTQQAQLSSYTFVAKSVLQNIQIFFPKFLKFKQENSFYFTKLNELSQTISTRTWIRSNNSVNALSV